MNWALHAKHEIDVHPNYYNPMAFVTGGGGGGIYAMAYWKIERNVIDISVVNVPKIDIDPSGCMRFPLWPTREQ